MSNKLPQTRRPLRLTILLGLALLLLIEPALANKFEKIGGCVSGSTGFKREWLMKFFLVTGGVSVLGGILAVITPHRNPLFLNFSNWKQSATILFILGGIFLLAAGLL